jgi:hypothetical protein
MLVNIGSRSEPPLRRNFIFLPGADCVLSPIAIGSFIKANDRTAPTSCGAHSEAAGDGCPDRGHPFARYTSVLFAKFVTICREHRTSFANERTLA